MNPQSNTQPGMAPTQQNIANNSTDSTRSTRYSMRQAHVVQGTYSKAAGAVEEGNDGSFTSTKEVKEPNAQPDEGTRPPYYFRLTNEELIALKDAFTNLTIFESQMTSNLVHVWELGCKYKSENPTQNIDAQISRGTVLLAFIKSILKEDFRPGDKYRPLRKTAPSMVHITDSLGGIDQVDSEQKLFEYFVKRIFAWGTEACMNAMSLAELTKDSTLAATLQSLLEASTDTFEADLQAFVDVLAPKIDALTPSKKGSSKKVDAEDSEWYSNKLYGASRFEKKVIPDMLNKFWKVAKMVLPLKNTSPLKSFSQLRDDIVAFEVPLLTKCHDHKSFPSKCRDGRSGYRKELAISCILILLCN